MKVWAIRTTIALVFNAITLWVAAVLPGVRLGSGYLWVVLLFTAASLLLRGASVAFFRKLDGQGLDGGRPVPPPTAASRVVRTAVTAAVGLALSFGILWLTTVFAGGFSVSGATGWVIATVVVWLASIIFNAVDDGLENKAQQLLGGPGPGGLPRP